jgi:putative transposase
MGRKNRIESTDGLYHVINRGNYREAVFETEGARKAFESVLWEACERFGWELLAFAVMSNHFHLCLATPRGNLSIGMQWLQGTYAKRFNRYRKESGHLFQGRFKSLIVEPGRHLVDLVRYIHLNPVRAGLCPPESPSRYRWSSLYHFPKRRSRPDFLKAWWMDYEEGLIDNAAGWRRYLAWLQTQVVEDPKEWEKLDKRLCRGWCISSPDFKKAIAADLVDEPDTVRLERDELNDFNRGIWSAALEACLGDLKMTADDVARSRYSVPWKLAIASKLKRETAVSNAWLAENLNMGVPNSVSNLVGVYRRQAEAHCPSAKKLGNMKYER